MEMQDKEFDQLFKLKLDGSEAEPSAKVWKNIAGELDAEKTKRSIIPYLSIGASVIILISATLLFINHSQEDTIKKPLKQVKGEQSVKQQPATVANKVVTTVDIVGDKNAFKTSPLVQNYKTGAKQLNTQTIKQTKQENDIIIIETVTQNTEPVLAAVGIENPRFIPPAVTDNNVLISPDLLTAPLEKQLQVLTNADVEDKTPVKKRGIHSLGGLINVVVATIDKREDKLIEFTDADNDEGSRLTSVNLGIFKIKKQ